MGMRSLRFTALAVLVCQAIPARSAHAQSAALTPQQAAARRGLISDATAARDAGDHTHAVDLGERAGRIQMTPSLRVFIAQERLALGQLVEAFGSAELCVHEATDGSTVHRRDEIVTECRSLMTQIESRLGRVVVRVPNPLPVGFELRVANAPLADALYGVPYRVTPGTVAVDARAADGSTFHADVPVTSGQQVDVAVSLRAPMHVQAATVAVAAPIAHQPPPPVSASTPIAPLVVAGVGVLGLIAGGVLYGLRIDARNTLIGTYCSPATGGFACDNSTAARDAYARAVTFDTAATATLIAGAAVTVAGAVWFFVARGSSHADRVRASFAPLDRGGFVSLGASF